MGEKTAAQKRQDTIQAKKEAEAKRYKDIAAKRQQTIQAKKDKAEKALAKRARTKKLQSYGTKPIFWIFFIFGWMNAFYWLFVIARFLIKIALES